MKRKNVVLAKMKVKYMEKLPQQKENSETVDYFRLKLFETALFIVLFFFILELFLKDITNTLWLGIILLVMTLGLSIFTHLDINKFRPDLYVKGRERRFKAMDDLRADMGFASTFEGRLSFAELALSLQERQTFFKAKKFSNVLIQCLIVAELGGFSYMASTNSISLRDALVIAFLAPIATFLVSFFQFPADSDFITTVKEYKEKVEDDKIKESLY